MQACLSNWDKEVTSICEQKQETVCFNWWVNDIMISNTQFDLKIKCYLFCNIWNACHNNISKISINDSYGGISVILLQGEPGIPGEDPLSDLVTSTHLDVSACYQTLAMVVRGQSFNCWVSWTL